MSDALDHVIRYSGAFYRSNRQGYTVHVAAAGLYTMREAHQEAAGRAGAQAVPLANYLDQVLTLRSLVDDKLEMLGFVVERMPPLPKTTYDKVLSTMREGNE